MAPNNNVPNLVIYNSSNAYQVLSAAVIKDACPNAVLHDIAGVAAATTTTYIGTLVALTYGSISVLATQGNSTGNIAVADIATLNGKLIGAPYDTVCREFNPAGTGSGSTFKQEPMNVWGNIYPNVNPPSLVRRMGGNGLGVYGANGTATSGAVGSLTDSGASFSTIVVDSLTATSVTATGLVDGTTWNVDAYVGDYVVFTNGNGIGQTIEIASNTVEVHVHGIRKKLGKNFIKTVRHSGYIIEDSCD